MAVLLRSLGIPVVLTALDSEMVRDGSPRVVSGKTRPQSFPLRPLFSAPKTA